MAIKEDLLKLLDDKQVENLVVINFSNHSPFLDYFIVGDVRNERMANATIQAVEDYCALNNIKVKQKDTSGESKWRLIDLGEIVIHIFYENERQKYDLEGLWQDLIEK